MGDSQQDEDRDETKKTSAKKKRKEIDLPITIRVSGVTKSELDRLIEQEVISKFFFVFEKKIIDVIF